MSSSTTRATRQPRIVIAGSRYVNPAAAWPLFHLLRHFDRPTLVLRRGRATPPGRLERELALLCGTLPSEIEWHVPAPGGRDEVYYRDIDMVTGADLVIGIFSEGHEMAGGTAHVIEKAIDQHVPAYAFVWDGQLRRVGEYDPDDIWGLQVADG